MSILIKNNSKFSLKKEDLPKIKEKIKNALKGKVQEAYFFGSSATGEINKDSDIDLIIIKETTIPFTKRAHEFSDLKDIFPDIDIIVYTKDELKRQLDNSETGFWKNVKGQLERII